METDKEVFSSKAEGLVDRMTVEEMIEQLRFDAPALPRLGIPSYNWWNEGLHGAARSGTASVFPQAIGLAASFDTELLKDVADCTATEQRAKYNAFSNFDDRGIYKGLTVWSPNINIFRDPRWGRGQETFGEDPFLTARLGVAFINGLQGSGIHLKTAACVKHFAAHSGPEPLRHSFNASVSARDLSETYLPAFEACVKEGKVNAVMGAYSALNGEPCCGSGFLMKKTLRREWGFKGMYISDCWAVRDFHLNHKVTDTETESAALALNSGCDLNCGDMYRNLPESLEQGLVTEERIREACIRNMTTRFELGILDGGSSYDAINFLSVDSPEHRKLCLEASRQSLVLLKNDYLLPINASDIGILGIVGPNADSRAALLGNYSGTPGNCMTVLEGFRQVMPESTRILYSEGSGLIRNNVERLGEEHDRNSEALTVTDLSDIVVLCLGLNAEIEGEMHDDGNGGWAGDKANLRLPYSQRRLLRTVARRNTPVILVLISGGAIDPEIENLPNVKAVIQAWYPGEFGGLAIGELITGLFSPSGRLPVTFYSRNNTLPDFTDYSMEGRTYRYLKEEPLYPFGFGLSYSTFKYSDLTLGEEDSETLEVKVTLKNTGNRRARETVQIYCWTPSPDFPIHPVLCGFRKAILDSGRTEVISIKVNKKSFFGVDRDGIKYPICREWTLFAGGSQPDRRSIELTKGNIVQTSFSPFGTDRMTGGIGE